MIERWRTDRLSTGKAPSTVNRDLTVFRSLFSKALEWGLIEVHPFAKIKPHKVDNAKVRYLDKEEEERLKLALDPVMQLMLFFIVVGCVSIVIMLIRKYRG